MKKFLAGLLIGLLLATTTFALANPQIKLIINGQEIQADVPPQNINGRVMVPARYVAETLGAKVEWDAAKNAVVITSQNTLPAPNTSTISPGNGIMEEKGEGKTVSAEYSFEEDGFFYDLFSGILPVRNLLNEQSLSEQNASAVTVTTKQYKDRNNEVYPVVRFASDVEILEQKEVVVSETDLVKLTYHIGIFPVGTKINGANITWENNGVAKSVFVPADFVLE